MACLVTGLLVATYTHIADSICHANRCCHCYQSGSLPSGDESGAAGDRRDRQARPSDRGGDAEAAKDAAASGRGTPIPPLSVLDAATRNTADANNPSLQIVFVGSATARVTGRERFPPHGLALNTVSPPQKLDLPRMVSCVPCSRHVQTQRY